MKVKPLISIIVPIYNVEKYLDRCISSIVNQTYENLEIILVDDGSPDNCPDICNKWAEKDSRIIVIHQKNGGVSVARNVGVEHAHGDYLGFVDSDDWIEPQMYEKLLSVIVNKGVDMVYCGIVVDGDDSYIFPDQVFDSDHHGLLIAILKNGGGIYLSLWNMLIRRVTFGPIKFPVNSTSEDYAMLASIAYRCNQVSYIADKFYHYNRENVDSITHGKENPRASYAHFVGDRIRWNYAKIFLLSQDIIDNFDDMACRAAVRAIVGDAYYHVLNDDQRYNITGYLKTKIETTMPNIGMKKRILAKCAVYHPSVLYVYALFRFTFKGY